MNSKEFGFPFSKKGYLRGYIKYGVFAYLSWYYFKLAISPPAHGHGHGAHGHDSHGHHDSHSSHAAHGHDSHEKKHH